MTSDAAPALLRIGELSRRLGVSTHVLRAWERRYGLLRPVRSAGGFRLYSAADEERVRRMQAHLGRGLAAAEAARAALAETALTETQQRQSPPVAAAAAGEPTARDGLGAPAAALRRALDQLDEPAAQAALDRLLADFTVETVLRDVVLPYLRDLGERWESGTVSVTGEHFASNLVRARLAGLARGWGRGYGPLAVLACPPGELHDLPLLIFGLVLHREGWRIAYLGADTPLPDLNRTVDALRPDLVVLAAVTPERFTHARAELARLAGLAPVALGGRGATPELARAVGGRLLANDPVTEAQRITPSADSTP